MIRIMLLCFLFSCQRITSKEGVKPIPIEPNLKKDTEGEMSFDDLKKAFSMRDKGPDCDVLSEHIKDFDKALVSIVQDHPYPPWAPMRAANCLIESQSPLAKQEMLRWLSEPNTMGLAINLANHLSQIESEFSKKLIEAGLNGPHKVEFEKRLSRSEDGSEKKETISNEQQ